MNGPLFALLLAAPARLWSQGPAVGTAAFRGESCLPCHASMRDRAPEALRPELPARDAGAHDVVVVGAGLAGLSAAYYLRDLDVLVLDKESRVGGKVRRESMGERRYPVGAVYMGEPAGEFQELFEALGLKLDRITLTDHTLIADGRRIPDWISGDPSRLPIAPEAQARFREFQKELHRFEETGGLAIPVEDSDPAALARYDRSSFYQWIESRYGPEVAAFGDHYSKDVFGIGGREVSAAAGLLYMASELTPSYTWEGGLGSITEALGRALGGRVRTGAFVWRVSQDADGAVVEFHDGERDFKARGRAVILATPSMVSRRIVGGLSQAKRSALEKVRYSSYAMVPLRLKRVLWKDSFVLWTPGRAFMDLTLPLPSADVLRGATEQVLVAYMPMGESEGRRKLLSAKDEELADAVLRDLDTVLEGASAEVAEARVIRWGHAMPVAYPGYLTRVRPAVAKPEGRLLFAGVDTQLPAVEGAFHSGRLAALKARRLLRNGVTTQLPPTENSPPRGGRIPDALPHGEGVSSVGGGPEQLRNGTK